MGRTEASIRNARTEIACYFITTIANFLSRWAFVKLLPTEYLGLSGVFSSVLSILSLAELGIGTAVTCNLYRPLADDDRAQVAAIMALYRNAYRMAGTAVVLLGIALVPFLGYLVPDMGSVPDAYLVYGLFVANSALSYLFSYKKSLAVAAQKQYLSTAAGTAMDVACPVLKIAGLWLTGNYFVYFGIGMAMGVFRDVAVSNIVDRMYPYAAHGKASDLDAGTRRRIWADVRALFLHDVGGAVVFGTDNMLISMFDGIVAVGLYSNYSMVVSVLSRLYGRVISSATASIGDMGVSGDKGLALSVFWKLEFLCCALYGFSTACLASLLGPFVELWLGSAFVMDWTVTAAVALNFYLRGMRQAVLAFRAGYGLYRHDRFRPIAEAAVNLAASILLARKIGFVGVLFGTSVSTVATCFWREPQVLFRHGLAAPLMPYFKAFARNTAVTLIASAGACAAVHMAGMEGIAGFILKCAAAASVSGAVFFAAYHRREEFRYFLSLSAGIWPAIRRHGKGA